MNEQVRKSFDGNKPPSVIFILMILTNILINLDHGILPACTKQMSEKYDMDETELGILGSIVYLGISLMGMFAGRLYQHFNSKILTVVALILLEVSLLLFVFSDNKFTVYSCRFLTGVCQVFLLVYYPVWIDKFGRDKKTMWLTLLQICVPVGIFLGYGITAVIISMDIRFEVSFIIQIAMVTCFIIVFLFISNQKLDSRRRLSEDLSQVLMDGNNNRDSQLTEEQMIKLEEDRDEIKNKYKFSYMIRKLAKSKMYLVGTFTMSVILFVSTGIQFWLTKYLIDSLGYPEKNVFIAYAVVSLTGPTTGCGFGGYVISRIGGYDHPKTVYYVFIFGAIGIGAAVIIPFVQNFWLLCSLLWITLYFGGAMMPGLTGMMMSSVSPYLRSFGNSTGEIIKNFFGYLPSPFIYGLFNSQFGDRAGIKFLMLWGLWAPILLLYGSFHKYKQLKKLATKEHLQQQKPEPQYSDMQQEQPRTLQQQTLTLNNQQAHSKGLLINEINLPSEQQKNPSVQRNQ